MISGYTPRGRLITLTPDELAKAKAVGDGRNAANRGVADKPYYDRDKMEDDETASFAAAAGECAVAKAFGVAWHAGVWPAAEHWRHAEEPDCGERIEVKRVRKPDNGLVVREKDVALNRFVVLAYPLPEAGYGVVDVIGWIAATDGWAIGADSGRGYKRVAQKHLHAVPGLEARNE